MFASRPILAPPAAALCLALGMAVPAAGQTSRVSVTSNGAQANSFSEMASVSADGNLIAFYSNASNIDGTPFGAFVHDRTTGQTTRISFDAGFGSRDGFSPAISGNGRFVAYEDVVDGFKDLYLYDRAQGITTRVSVGYNGAPANWDSSSPTIDGVGRMVAFFSYASNLVPGDTNGFVDVFVRDTVAGQTRLVSVGFDGTQANSASSYPTISANGRFVAFDSSASNLVPVPKNMNASTEVFVRDLDAGVTTRVSVASDGTVGNGSSFDPAISADGRYIAFASNASNLVPGDTNGAVDVFVHDRLTGQTDRVSVASNGAQAYPQSIFPSISGDGRLVAFSSYATNLVPEDTNNNFDVFVHDRQTGRTRRVSVASDGLQGNDYSGIGNAPGTQNPRLSADGTVVVFGSAASNLVPGDTNRSEDIFVRLLPETAPEPPDPPINLIPEVRGSDVTLSWTAATAGGPAIGFVVRAGLSPGATAVEFAPTGAATSIAVAGVPRGTYYLRVHGRNAAGTSLPSDELVLVVGPPATPTGLTAAVGGSTVSFTWAAPAAGPVPDSYVLRGGLASGAQGIEVATGGPGTSFTAGGVPPGRYFVRVHARNIFGTGGPSNEIMIDVAGCSEPPAPPAAREASVSGTLVTLTWSAPDCAASYVLEAGSSPGATDDFAGNIGNVTTLTAAVPRRTYFVRVRAVNAFGVSGPSGEVVVVVP